MLRTSREHACITVKLVVAYQVRLKPSSLLFKWRPWDIIHANWLFTEWRVPNKWHCTTAVCCLSGHCVHANNNCNDSSVKKKESKDTDGNHAIEKDWVFWFPLDVAILVDLSRHTSGAGSDQNHDELNQKRPCGHVHAILAPTLRSTFPIGEHQCTHAGTHEKDGQHGAEHHDALAIFHGLSE